MPYSGTIAWATNFAAGANASELNVVNTSDYTVGTMPAPPSGVTMTYAMYSGSTGAKSAGPKDISFIPTQGMATGGVGIGFWFTLILKVLLQRQFRLLALMSL